MVKPTRLIALRIQRPTDDWRGISIDRLPTPMTEPCVHFNTLTSINDREPQYGQRVNVVSMAANSF
jgi:hypothetical protein